MAIHHLALIRANEVVGVAVCDSDSPDLVWLGAVLADHEEVVDLGSGSDAGTPGVGWTRADENSPFVPPVPAAEPD